MQDPQQQQQERGRLDDPVTVAEAGRYPSPSGVGRFTLGRLVATRGVVGVGQDYVTASRPALAARFAEFLSLCIRLHHSGAWGVIPAEDAKANAEALQSGARILSSYPVPPEFRDQTPDDKLWIITDAAEDPAFPRVRTITTLLWPSDY